ncbi:MAG TPA: DUF1553 domain-containing protein [Bryobacteraceae bacterium]|nr:DUF1553 domain-containing protein [Bryobacteraceae bacterium]
MMLRVPLACLWATLALASPGRAEEQPSDLIDRHIFGRMQRDKIPHAPAAGDSEFLRRVYLDVTGRLPAPAVVTRFLASKDADKRRKLIDSLFPPLPTPGMRSVSEDPFYDRWTYFFCDLFRNGQLLQEGINTFYDYIYKTLTLNVPYDDFVREMITASAVSTWVNGPANFLARNRVFEGDGYVMNQEDTNDEIAITTGKLFLGVNLECISCHDGKGHLEKINLWLARKKRADVWREASFFGKTYISPEFGRSPQFIVNDTRKGYDLTTVSSLRPPRNPKEDAAPAFILDGGRPYPGEKDRPAFARMITGHPQFARATVNLIWAELMGAGIVDPVFDFDLDRQDPAHPPPAPWTVQPSHPELLNELAADFRAHGHDLRRLIRAIVSSRAYQLSGRFPGEWKENYESYFARRKVRRLSAEQAWDAISQLTDVFTEIKVTYSAKKAKYIMQTRSPQDIDKTDRPLYKILQAFGQCDRYDAEAARRASMTQAAILLNDKIVRERVKAQKGSRLEKLLQSGKPDASKELLDELFLAALSRFPSGQEAEIGMEALRENKEQGAEDLAWAMINRLDFLFY